MLSSTAACFGDQEQHLMQERHTRLYGISFKKEREFPYNLREPLLCRVPDTGTPLQQKQVTVAEPELPSHCSCCSFHHHFQHELLILVE